MSDNANNRIFSNGTALTIGPGMTIRGAGQIGINQTNIINNGSILAQGGNTLTIDSNNFTNAGIIRAEGLGGLVIVGSTIHNNTAIDVAVNSKLQLSSSTFNGGIFNNTLGGSITANANTFNTVTLNGTLTQINGADNNFTNGVTINGSWNLGSTNASTDMTFTGSQTIGGTGEIVLSNNGNNRIFSNGNTITVDTNATIRGAGQIGLNQTSLINKGTITADQTNALNIDTSGTGLNNQGTLNATGTGGINILTSAFTTSGNINIAAGSKINRTGSFVQTAGHTKVNGTLTSSSGVVSIQGGLLSGSGLINGNVTNGGTVGPGNSPGTLTISGDYVQTTTGLLDIELAGLLAGAEYDVLNVTGSANLAGGVLEVDVLAGFNPIVGNSFDILQADSILGTFNTLSLDNSYIWQVEYLEDIFGLNTIDVVRLTILEVSQVPVPASVWLFGSGLLGLVGIARRKTLL